MDTNTFHNGDYSAAAEVANHWWSNYGDMKPHVYHGRNDYLLYIMWNTSKKYQKSEGVNNHIHIWNTESGGVGYKFKNGCCQDVKSNFEASLEDVGATGEEN